MSKRTPVALSRRGSREAFTLVELLVSMSIIGLVAGSSIFALLDSNRFASIDRMRSAAKAACQEKIDQALTTPYSSDALPAMFTAGTSGTIPAPVGTPDRGTVTQTESIPLYVDQAEATPTNGVAKLVQGSRTTRVSLSDATMGLVRVWVRVAYKFQGKDYSYEMYVVRAPD